MKRPLPAAPVRKRARRQPWELPEGFPSGDWTAEIVALQSLSQGAADQFQQRIAWKFLLDVLCQVDEQSFQPGGSDGDRATAFAEGKRWVGRMLQKVARLKPQGFSSRDEPPPMPAASEKASDEQ